MNKEDLEAFARKVAKNRKTGSCNQAPGLPVPHSITGTS